MTIKLPLKNSTEYVLIDEEYLSFLSCYDWCLAKRGKHKYAIANVGKYSKKLMHRFLLNVTDPKIQVDHINGNGLDNRKCNLRQCTNQQNHFNQNKRNNTTSKYKGVYWNKAKNKWQVSVKTLDSKTKSLGRYDTEKEAAEVYNKYVLTVYGEYAKLNKIDD